MARPADDHQLWKWEIVAPATRRTQQGVRTAEARVAHRPDRWYLLATHLTAPRGPCLVYDVAVSAAQAAVPRAGTSRGRYGCAS